MKKKKNCNHSEFFVDTNSKAYCFWCGESKESIDNGINMRIQAAKALVNNRN